MCGRFTLYKPAERIAREFQLEEIPSLEARYNIAPTQNVLAVRHSPDGREAVLFKWGLIPLIMCRISAGFPTPAEDYVEGRIDLNRDLIKHPFGTFYIRISGDSMEPKIHEGSLILVDRMMETKDNDIIVARIGCDLCVKRLRIESDGKVWLLAENPQYPPIQITEELDFEVWGRMLNSIDFL